VIRRACCAAGLAGLAAFAVPRTSVAQGVLIAPQAVVIDSRTRTGELTLVNESNSPAEVAVSTLYGYPVTDTAGMMSLQTFDTVADTAPSAAPWIQVFPRRLRLAPRARQTLRILVSPPDSLPDREYWARIVVAVRGAQIPLETGSARDIHAGLALEVRSVLGLFYRSGAVSTGVSLANARASVHADSLVARVDLACTGNAAFVGSLKGTLRDSLGVSVATGLVPLGVYYTLAPRLSMATRGLRAGTYTLTLEAESTRPDVAPRLLLKAPSKSLVITVTIP
jgi:P pilus assembly chaperone PapD